jgi:hypothetical protein
LKEAGEKGWSTIPVPAGFDIKEAGGTVFEAQNVIDYFLRIIASTMHVPVSVVGVETRELPQTEKSDDLLRYKEAFKTAIETQLFKLLIWTKYGDKKVKQGGAKDPQYLPEIRFRVEELMDGSNRLKMCKEILNVANPVRPETKLEVERDICKIMGYDVLLPSQEQYKKDLEKAEAEMKKKLAENPAQAGEEKPVSPTGEKFQGPPKPQTEEQQQKRLDKGVNVRKAGSAKGKKESKTDTFQESVPEVIPAQQLEITVKTEKQEPQRVEVLKEPEKTKESIEADAKKLENEKTKADILKKISEKVNS